LDDGEVLDTKMEAMEKALKIAHGFNRGLKFGFN